MSLPILYIVIPCYNEQDVLPITAPMFEKQLNVMINNNKISDKSSVLFVNDGSKDNTWDLICDFSKNNPQFKGISQSRNRGHQNAVLAGLMEAKKHCDIAISIDCDGQDDITVMEKMVDEYLNGADVVYGVRAQRKTDTFFKRFTAQCFYRFIKQMGVETVYNHADYRLTSKRVLDALESFKEVNLFLRGMFPLIGFKSTSVYYDRNERMAGKSHYPLKKMISLAIDGITSLSIKPIRIITTFGFIVALLSVVGIIWSIVIHLLNQSVAGWSSIICIISFFSGIQILGIGIIGEYIGKIYLETKRRPRYIISEKTDNLQSKEDK